MSDETLNFDKPTVLSFIGGRWDGLEIEAMKAPEVLFVSPEGAGIAPAARKDCPPTFTPYLRTGFREKCVLYCEAEEAF